MRWPTAVPEERGDVADANLGPTTAERLEGIVFRGAEAMFFAAAAEGRLVFGRCSSCDATMFPPRALARNAAGGICASSRAVVEAPS